MILLDVSLLPRCLRITEENVRSSDTGFSKFKSMWILEFDTIVSKNNRKKFPECFYSELISQPIKNTLYAVLRGVFKQEDKHEVAISKYQR